MQISDLEKFNEVPFFFWAKDETGKYLWANQAMNDFAGEEIIGKTDADFVWADEAEVLQAVDQNVLTSERPRYIHESVDHSTRGKANLSVCKWPGELDGTKCCFGISFVID